MFIFSFAAYEGISWAFLAFGEIGMHGSMQFSVIGLKSSMSVFTHVFCVLKLELWKLANWYYCWDLLACVSCLSSLIDLCGWEFHTYWYWLQLGIPGEVITRTLVRFSLLLIKFMDMGRLVCIWILHYAITFFLLIMCVVEFWLISYNDVPLTGHAWWYSTTKDF